MAKKNNITAVDLGAKVRVIPVLVYGILFNIKLTASNLSNYLDKLQASQAGLEEQAQSIQDGDWDAAREVLKKYFDLTLGDGAFDKIAAKEDDPILLAQTFKNVCGYMSDEFNKFAKEAEKEKAQAVIDAKKAKGNAK